jgi:UDP-N-acetylmuramoylalanine--D-glutamate ligase
LRLILKNKKCLVMGLGLHGGGLASTKYLHSQGAKVKVTDLRSKHELRKSLVELEGLDIEYTLGKHLDKDFLEADIIIKNPGVPRSSKYLQMAKQIETDISLFLDRNTRPVLAVTGSKGKSTTVSALYWAAKQLFPHSLLGGNITNSPLNFIEDCLEGVDPVILETSSWQLGDLNERSGFHPQISCITNIMNDHQNAYASMADYVHDKQQIYRFQNKEGITFCNFDDSYGQQFAADTPAKVMYFSAYPLPAGIPGIWIEEDAGYIRFPDGKTNQLFTKNALSKGVHNRLNLCIAGGMLAMFKGNAKGLPEALDSFTGIAHRMELVRTLEGIEWINDSAATIPEATIAAIKSFDSSILQVIVGGTDKKLDFKELAQVLSSVKNIHLLAGSGTNLLTPYLDRAGIAYLGPFQTMEEAVSSAQKHSNPGDRILMSPGCASFEFFQNEFDRGNQFRDLVLSM